MIKSHEENERQTSGKSIRLVILIIMTLYLSRLVLSATNHRYVNKLDMK